MKTKLSITFLFAIAFYTIQAQIIDYTGFEDFDDETVFTRSSWVNEGFTVSWVNGFNQNRAHIDSEHAIYGSSSLRILYPADNYGTSGTGAQAPLRVDPEDELYATYWLRFSENFDWGGEYEGGKLPGLAGTGLCSGCQDCTGNNGFTARLMWRQDGRGVLYLYHMDKVNNCGDDHALQLSGTDFYFEKGQWYNIIQRVKINTEDNHDGEVEVWINEEPAILMTGIRFVNNGSKVDHLYFSTFHGGNSSEWAPSEDCHIWFDNIVIAHNAEDVFSFTGLHDHSLNNEISAYPNPVSSNSQLNFVFNEVTTSTYSTEWLTVSGNTVKKSEIQTGNSIPVPNLKSGMYMLKLTIGDDVIHKKIIVE
jgi:hypothetical protein